MASIKITTFGGEIPVKADHLLADGQAQQAQNVRLSGGSLRTWQKPFTTFSPIKAAVASVFRMPNTAIGDVWLAWTEDVNAVPGPIANDTDHKVYYTGQATPRKTNYTLATNGGATTECPNDYLELGLPAPSAAPSLSVSGGSGATTTRTYFYTFVSTWGEESKPSPTVTVTGFTNGSWGLSALQTTIAGKYSLSKQRIYRSLTDSYGNVNMQLVVEQAPAGTYADSLADAALGAICSTTNYDVPPSDLTHLISLPNGVMAAFSPSSKQLCFCEPYQPHAWPNAYRYAVEYVPVGIAANGNSVLVVTQGAPYIFSGTHPATMSAVKLPTVEPGVAKKSVIDAGFGVMYATNNGFVLASHSGVDLASEQFFSRREWALLNPASMRFAKYGDCIYIFYKTTDAVPVYGGYILDKDSGMVSINLVVDGCYVDSINGRLYVIQDNKIKQWDGDPIDVLSYTWKSRRVITPRPVNFGVAQVDADYDTLATSNSTNTLLARQQSENTAALAANADIKGSFDSWMFNDGSATAHEGAAFNGSLLHDLQSNPLSVFITFKLWANGVLRFTKNLLSRAPFRLPAGYKSDDYTLEIDSSVEVRSVQVAETQKELQLL